MAESFRVGKLHRPPDVGRRADNLAVDEVADASHAQQERRRNDEDVGDEQERPSRSGARTAPRRALRRAAGRAWPCRRATTRE